MQDQTTRRRRAERRQHRHSRRRGLDVIDERAVLEKLPTIHAGVAGPDDPQHIGAAGLEREGAVDEGVARRTGGELQRGVRYRLGHGVSAEDAVDEGVVA